MTTFLNTRTRLLLAIVGAAAIGAFIVFAAISRIPEAAAAKRPNFIVLQTDDQSPRLMKSTYRGADGRLHRTMPKTRDLMIRNGTEFGNYYATSPVCSPSRASLLTGQYPENDQLLTNGGPFGGWQGWLKLPIKQENLQVTLQNANYRTSHFGKFTNSYYNPATGRGTTVVPPGWDNWFTNSFRSGENRYYGYTVNDNGKLKGPFGRKNYAGGGGRIDPASCRIDTARVRVNGRWRRCNYITDLMTRHAVSEIKNGGSKPFYLQIDYDSPHGDVVAPVGAQPATRHIGSAIHTKMPTPPNFNEADMSDKPKVLRQITNGRLSRTELRQTRIMYRSELEALRSVDDSVGAIVKALRKTGQLANTYIVLLSDHGFLFGEHRFPITKFLPYEESSGVSMVVRGPGVKHGARAGEIVGNIDIAPTVLNLSGATPEYAVDGRSLRPYWRHPGKRSRRPLQISLFAMMKDPPASASTSSGAASGATASTTPAQPYYGYRVGPYKLVKYRFGGREMYDLNRDPYELHNAYRRPGYAKVRKYMNAHFNDVVTCAGTECRRQLPPWPSPARR